MEILKILIDELKPYEKNPRNNDAAVEYVANSIKSFGFKVPIIIDKDNIIVAGHTRYKAAISLGLKEVPCIVANDLTGEQIKAFRLADNKVSEVSEWDNELLSAELEELQKINFDMEQFNFDLNFNLNDSELTEESIYTSKIEIPQYLITDDKPEESELVDDEKTMSLIEEIKEKNLPEEIEKFLIYGAYRHLVFDYGNIAEYYAHADKEVQELIEKSAMVIIDYDNAIANGFARVSKRIQNMIDGENE